MTDVESFKNPNAGETMQLQHDPFLDMLPFLLSDEVSMRQEPTFDELADDAKQRYVELIQQRTQLAGEGKFATGTGVVIFVSDIGVREDSDYIDGVDEPLLTYGYEESEEEYDEHLRAAEGIKHRINQITNSGVAIDVQTATNEAIETALQDESVAHMIYIGHANDTAITTGVDSSFNWDQPIAPLTHLKASFGVFGCGAGSEGGPYPRFGTAFVAPEGVAYGVPGDYLDEGTPYQFDELVRLPIQTLAGTPQELNNAA